MKQLRKGASVILALVLTLSLVLTACGNNNNNDTSNTGDTGSNTAVNTSSESNPPSETQNDGAIDPSKLKPYEIKLIYVGPPQKDEAKVEEALNKILKEKINATVDIAPIDWSAWDDKMNLLIASQEKFDVVFTAQWKDYTKNAAKGAFLDLGPLLDKYGQGIKETLDPLFLEGSKIKGINYAVPSNKELAAQGGLIYRKDIADELGIDMTKVKTVDDLDAVFKIVKEKKPDMIPLWDPWLASETMLAVDMLGAGGTGSPGVISKTGTDTTIKVLQETPEYLHAIKLARDFYLKGYVPKDVATTQAVAGDAYKAGKLFSTLEGLKPGKAEENEIFYDLKGKLAQVELTPKTVSTGETAGAMLAISSTSKDPERAMMFINLLHTDKEINNLLSFGIEGVHYTLNGEVMTPTADTPNYAPGAAWQLGNQFLNRVWDSENPEKWRLFKEFNEGAIASPALGFVFDTEPVKAEVGALANVMKQHQKGIETGTVDPDKYLPEFVDAMKKVGIQKVIDEEQRQFNEFLATK